MPETRQGIPQLFYEEMNMLGISIKITKLTAINNELATFNCDGQISGVIHSPADGSYTVVIDGGYKLAMHRCPHCAIKAVHNLADQIHDADKSFGMNYNSYKTVFLSGANSRTH